MVDFKYECPQVVFKYYNLNFKKNNVEPLYTIKQFVLMDGLYWCCWLNHTWIDTIKDTIDVIRFDYKHIITVLICLKKTNCVEDTFNQIFLTFMRLITIYENNCKPWYLK
jgi:hypothetical protein